MRRIELNDVEYGDCTVLIGKNQEILMVDCGSMNQKLRDGELPMELRFEQIAQRYASFTDRHFLLTHYHRDHLCGFKKILETHPGYFSRVLIPASPLDKNGSPLLIDFALFAHLFLPAQSDCSQVNTSCLRIFRYLEKALGSERIFTLRAGDLFSFDETEYEVLWPRRDDFPFSNELSSAIEEMNILFSSPFLPLCAKEFLKYKESFLQLYLQCADAFCVSGRALPEIRRELLSLLEENLRAMEELKAELNLTPNAHKVRDILTDPLLLTAFSDSINASSVVFHNRRTGKAGSEDLLMTGDATPEVLESLEDRLYDGYNIIKAPHHGTASGWCRLFSDLGSAHILISNGDYHAGGAIAQEYIDLENVIRHCTNSNACKWYQASGGCCNRLSYCFDQTPGAGLAIKCPAASGNKAPGCGIEVITASGRKGCFCEA